jgi:hypothetical protein
VLAAPMVSSACDVFRRLPGAPNGDGDLPPASTEVGVTGVGSSGLTTAYLNQCHAPVTPFEAAVASVKTTALVVRSLAGATVARTAHPTVIRAIRRG